MFFSLAFDGVYFVLLLQTLLFYVWTRIGAELIAKCAQIRVDFVRRICCEKGIIKMIRRLMTFRIVRYHFIISFYVSFFTL